MLTLAKKLSKSAQRSYFQYPMLNYGFSQLKSNNNNNNNKNDSHHKNQNQVRNKKDDTHSRNKAKKVSTAVLHTSKDCSLNEYMSKIYKANGLSFACSLGLGYILSLTPLGVTYSDELVGLGVAIGLVGLNSYGKSKTDVQKNTNEDHLETKLAFKSFLVATGLALNLPIQKFNSLDPFLVPTGIVFSLISMWASSSYSLTQPTGQFSTWKTVLFGSWVVFLTLQLIGLGVSGLVGANPLSTIVLSHSTYIFTGLFTLAQIYDTNKAVEEYRKGNYNHLMHVMRWFVRLITVLLFLREKEKIKANIVNKFIFLYCLIYS